jgi:signal transduction histidine kinase
MHGASDAFQGYLRGVALELHEDGDVVVEGAPPDAPDSDLRARAGGKGFNVPGRTAASRQIIRISDVRADTSVAWWEATPGAQTLTSFRSTLGVPMLRDGRLVGVLCVWRDQVNAFTDQEVSLATTFADQAGLAIENVRLFAEIEQKSRELEEASRHKSEFLANMSHELRTPLNAIIGFSEVLLERYFGELNEKQDDYLKDVVSSGHHLLALINDILDLSKVEAGRMELEVAPFDVGHALEAGIVMVKERASKKGIALALAVGDDVGRVEADERKIKQIVFNLLTNAVKFTSEGGQVTLSARRTHDAIEIAVADTGVGIAPEDLGKIFEEFGQARNQAGQTEGTGLGLALVQRYAALHGGSVRVESTVGHGSTFTVSIPARNSAADA